jgi:hypothetical protein
MAEPDGAAIYGIWHCIVGACSQQKKRNGWLTSDGESAGSPWGVSDLALKFRRPEKEVERALQVLCSEKVGWIIAHGNSVVTADSPPTHLEEKGREEKERKEGNGDGARVDVVLKLAAGTAQKLTVDKPPQEPSVVNLSALQQIVTRMNSIYRRPGVQRWDYDEETALVEVSKREGVLDEMAHIFYYRSQMPMDDRKRFFPQSVRALLTNWGATLDKARIQAPQPKAKTVVKNTDSKLKPFTPSLELAEKFRAEAKL